MYAGGAYRGVWKSSNAGPLSPSPASVLWASVIDDQATLSVGSIAIQPQLTNPDPAKSVVLVGTGETDNALDSYYGLGILRSADGGGTWTLISQAQSGQSFAGLGFSQIAFSTTQPNLVVAGASLATQGFIEDLENPPFVNRGPYYSINAGQAWTFANVTDNGVTASATSAFSVVFNASAGKFYTALAFHGIYSSSDGINWSRLATQPGTGLSTAACPITASRNCPIYRGQLAVVPGRNEMYLWYVDLRDNDQGIWKTTDGG